MKKLLILFTLLLISGCVITQQPTEVIAPEPEYTVEKEAIEKLHWNHLPITYFITNEEECGDYETRKIQRAFDRNRGNG